MNGDINEHPKDDASDRLVSTLREIAKHDSAPASVGMIAATAAVLIRVYDTLSAFEDVFLAGESSAKLARQLEARESISKTKQEISEVLTGLIEYGDKHHGGS